jgi:hypothetical protein
MPDLQAAFKVVDAFIEQQMAAAGTPGVAVAITDREQLRYLSTHGWADVAARRPVDAKTLFEIGSISKSFTAIALLQLSEAGLVDLQAPVRRYLPWFSVRSRYEAITIHHLLSHTAGIIRGTDFSGEARYEVWALRETETSTPPGTHFYYSGLMLVWECQSLDLKVLWLPKQAVDKDAQGVSSQLAVESSAQTPERMGMIRLDAELLAELAVDRLDDLPRSIE